ncbi:sigma-70 family RNA polymerase sigma factor [Gloeobacter kilaueensis]|uniref:RNA polymerase sigma factor SigF n=1 Tax=Gloeobacter kilaueensis (strain ATCC BAA-2537 / CCAP 1431/1 / ULC 316 / JS1) TaxID=1183438 RepID=U5QLE9_GLOK1|nr:sigma-70 family RNA polymerase sigma factor [Gloeobacter kilaueensis]AGY58419.1 RNA polymerase sigma factor SigF [Gloeobacter kilaueensis JS1]
MQTANRPTMSERQQQVLSHIGLVYRTAHRLSRISREPFEDLVQVGILGLIRAIDRFDPARGNAFSSFAAPYIQGEMQHYLRDRADSIRLPRRWQELARQAQKLGLLGMERLPEQQIAHALGITLDEWLAVSEAQRNRVPLSLDAPLGPHPEAPTLAESLPDRTGQYRRQNDEDRLLLQQALSSLDPLTRDIVESVFLRECTRHETARRIGISPVTVSRRLRQGVAQLQHLLQDPGSAPPEVTGYPITIAVDPRRLSA